MSVFVVRVPVRWVGLPWSEGSAPLSWLGEGDTLVDSAPDAAMWPSTQAPEGALSLHFRSALTGRDEMAIQRRIDELHGGLRETVEIETTRAKLWAVLMARYEARLWPTGRPRALSVAEAQAQDLAVNRLYAVEGEDRTALERLDDLCQRQRTFAEWGVAIINPPPGWARLEDREMSLDHMHAVFRAYRAAKAEAEAATGKAMRSGR